MACGERRRRGRRASRRCVAHFSERAASDVGVHPTSGGAGGAAWTTPRAHSITLLCDDLRMTMEELASRGAIFRGEPQDQGFGITVPLHVPGADDLILSEPRHRTAYDL